MSATATATKPAEAKEQTLTKAQIAEATKLRQGDGTKPGLTFVEIAATLGIEKAGIVSKALSGMPAGKPKSTTVSKPRAPKPSSLDWDTAVAGVKSLTGAVVAWPAAHYALVRADNSTTGVAKGRTIPGINAPWAAVCEHLTVKEANKGSVADSLARVRADWCADCKAEKPGIIPAAPRTPEQMEKDAAKEQAAKDKAVAKEAAAKEKAEAAAKAKADKDAEAAKALAALQDTPAAKKAVAEKKKAAKAQKDADPLDDIA